MFGSTTRGNANAYGKIGLETGVSAASPHKLIVMLYEGALTALSKAMHELKAGNIAAKGKSISHAISIIDGGLRASLDKESGGEIARSLDSLYEYMSDRLLHANLHNKLEVLEEIHGLLRDLKLTWESIAPDAAERQPQPAPAAAPQAAAPQAAPADPLAPRASLLFKA